jgi:hypothetical protein
MADFERRRDTRQAAAFLKDLGYETAAATLNKLRCVGGGPQFELFGRRPLYRETALLNWVATRLSAPRRSTSDRGAASQGLRADAHVGELRAGTQPMPATRPYFNEAKPRIPTNAPKAKTSRAARMFKSRHQGGRLTDDDNNN